MLLRFKEIGHAQILGLSAKRTALVRPSGGKPLPLAGAHHGADQVRTSVQVGLNRQPETGQQKIIAQKQELAHGVEDRLFKRPFSFPMAPRNTTEHDTWRA